MGESQSAVDSYTDMYYRPPQSQCVYSLCPIRFWDQHPTSLSCSRYFHFAQNITWVRAHLVCVIINSCILSWLFFPFSFNRPAFANALPSFVHFRLFPIWPPIPILTYSTIILFIASAHEFKSIRHPRKSPTQKWGETPTPHYQRRCSFKRAVHNHKLTGILVLALSVPGRSSSPFPSVLEWVSEYLAYFHYNSQLRLSSSILLTHDTYISFQLQVFSTAGYIHTHLHSLYPSSLVFLLYFTISISPIIPTIRVCHLP